MQPERQLNSETRAGLVAGQATLGLARLIADGIFFFFLW
jgi:hypothetical protein